MKRKSSAVAYNTRSKKPKLYPPLETKTSPALWLSASSTRNYMIKDPLIDWLKLYRRRGTKYNRVSGGGFSEFIMNRGVEFETELVKYINDKKVPVVKVSEFINEESIKKTKELMMLGVPIIHSAPIRNYRNKTRGVIDLLVRSDYLEKIVDECPLKEEEKVIKAPKLNGNYHYVVIDIKFSTLPLRSDGKHILNSNCYPAYKTQVCIYNQAIGLIQGYTPRYAYIMGRRWSYKKQNITFRNYTCINKLGVIDFEGVDKVYISKTNEALRWAKDVRQNGHKWSINPPSKKELYPNMCVDSGEWQKVKEEMSLKFGEITGVWYCGYKNREIGLSNNIKSWKNPRCSSKTIGVNGSRAKVIDKIIGINRQNRDYIWPKKIKSNLLGWKKERKEIFVDFETITDIFSPLDELPTQKSSDMIFMIGVYWKNKGNWEYKNFVCNSSTYEEEYRIMDEFNTFVKSQRNPKIWYWVAEKRFWTRSENRQFDMACEKGNQERMDHIVDDWKVGKWFDMCELFKKTPIVIKDCFKFGLKNIVKSMNKHGLIDTRLESDCDSGMSAMVKAYKCYNEIDNPSECSIMKDIACYNKFDVKALYDILTYLRRKHS